MSVGHTCPTKTDTSILALSCKTRELPRFVELIQKNNLIRTYSPIHSFTYWLEKTEKVHVTRSNESDKFSI